MNLLQYFRIHYQDNVIAGFINSLVVTIPSFAVLLWRTEKHHKAEETHRRKLEKYLKEK